MAKQKDTVSPGRFRAAAFALASAAVLLIGTGNSQATAATVADHYSVSVTALELLDQDTGEIWLTWTVSQGGSMSISEASTSLTGYCIRARTSGTDDWTESCGDDSSTISATVTVDRPYCNPEGVSYTLQGQARVKYDWSVSGFVMIRVPHVSEWSNEYKHSVTWHCPRSVSTELRRSD